MDRSRPLEERQAAFRRRHDWERFIARPTRPPTLKLMVTEWPKHGHGRPAARAGRRATSPRSSRSSRTSGSSTSRSTSTERICGCRRTSHRRRRPGRVRRGRDSARRWAGRRPVRRRTLSWTRPVESLPPGTAALVDEIFGPGVFRPDDHLPAYANRSRWGSDELETADFVFNPFGHGWHVRRRAFDAALLDAVRRWACELSTSGYPRPQAAFVIDATGRSARIARAFGARRSGRPARRGLPRSRRGGLCHHGRCGREWLGLYVAGNHRVRDGRRSPSAPHRLRHRRFHVLARPDGRPRLGRHRRRRRRLRPALVAGNRLCDRHGARGWPVAAGSHRRGIRRAVRIAARGAPRAARGVLRAGAALGRRPTSGGGGRT